MRPTSFAAHHSREIAAVPTAISRRHALGLGASIAAVTILPLGPLGPPKVLANPLFALELGEILELALTEAIKALVGWFVGRLLDGTFARRVRSSSILDVQARPTENAFHNAYSSPCVFDGQVIPTSRTRYGYFTSVDGCFRSHKDVPILARKDWNAEEMRTVCYYCGGFRGVPQTIDVVPYPCNFRREPTDDDLRKYEVACTSRSIDPDDYSPRYARPFTDGEKKYLFFLADRKGHGPGKLIFHETVA